LYPAGQLTQPPAQPRDPLMTNLDKHRPTLFAVEIRTSRWPELVAWYREVLGLEVLLRVVDDRYALLGAGSARLAILGRESTDPVSSRWSLGFEVVDLEVTRRALAAAGVDPPPAAANPEGFRELVITDPDGNRIRLFAWADERHC
jgi:predicted enzyme related to lactoylglutathione lyase